MISKADATRFGTSSSRRFPWGRAQGQESSKFDALLLSLCVDLLSLCADLLSPSAVLFLHISAPLTALLLASGRSSWRAVLEVCMEPLLQHVFWAPAASSAHVLWRGALAPSAEALELLPRVDDAVKICDGQERFWTLVVAVEGDRVEGLVRRRGKPGIFCFSWPSRTSRGRREMHSGPILGGNGREPSATPRP